MFSEALSAADCDCRSQLDAALAFIARYGGHVVYFYEEGRGAGLELKFRAINLQRTSGCDTASAFNQLGLIADPRDFLAGAAVVKYIADGNPVALLTNNPRKLEALSLAGVNIGRRVALVVPETELAQNYLDEKALFLGHDASPRRNPGESMSVLNPWPRDQAMVELHVDDFSRVEEFYLGLGFEIVWKREPEERKGYLVLRLERNVLCFWPGNETVYDRGYFSGFARETPSGYGVEIVVMVSEINTIYERAISLCRVETELKRRPWGLWDFRVVDPGGFYLRITEIHSIAHPRYAVG